MSTSMVRLNSFAFPSLSPMDLYYISIASNIFLYGYVTILTVGFVGNIFQILTFSRKKLRNLSTGVLFLALSISDTFDLLLTFYTPIVYGFHVSDQSNYAAVCRFRHFLTYLAMNFSAWTLTMIAAERWIRSQFPNYAQRFCTPRMAVHAIVIALLIDSILHFHIVTPLFGQIAPGVKTNCGADLSYPTYAYFFNTYWPIISILTVTIIPASCMVFFLVAITLSVRNHRNRVIPVHHTNVNSHSIRRAQFLQRQMLILMIITLLLFFLTTCPIALLHFALSTLEIQQSFSLNLLMISIFDSITLLNYALNFYFHCLTSKLFRKQFFAMVPCSISISCRVSQESTTTVGTH